MSARNEYLKVLQQTYFTTRSRKEKTALLDEYCRNTGQSRKYVIRKLHTPLPEPTSKHTRPRVYGHQVTAALATAWEIFDYPCGQRLAPLLQEEVPRLRRQGELLIPDAIAAKLERISSATIDRALQHEKEVRHRHRVHQKTHPLLSQQIPVQAGGWDRSRPGQVQIDAVQHSGTSGAGPFASTISCCDVATGWWDGAAVFGSGQRASCEAIDRMCTRSPFTWQALHSDNGSSFINWHLLGYCQQHGIAFTRSRPYQKNDNCFVEQKNATHVRAVVGYLRYDTDEEVVLLTQLYELLGQYKNFFQPVMKLICKHREKGRIHRHYDTPQTPYRRLMVSEAIPESTRQKLHTVYRRLNPAQLKRDLDAQLKELYRVHQEKHHTVSSAPHKKQVPRVTAKSYILNDSTNLASVT